MDSNEPFINHNNKIPTYNEKLFYTTYSDDNHLSILSSKILGNYIIKKINDNFLITN